MNIPNEIIITNSASLFYRTKAQPFGLYNKPSSEVCSVLLVLILVNE